MGKFNCGYCCLTGKGTPQDTRRAIDYFSDCLKLPDGLFSYGFLCRQNGIRLEKDPLQLISSAAHMGSSKAQYFLAERILAGDYEAGGSPYDWMKKAALNQHPQACLTYSKYIAATDPMASQEFLIDAVCADASLFDNLSETQKENKAILLRIISKQPQIVTKFPLHIFLNNNNDNNNSIQQDWKPQDDFLVQCMKVSHGKVANHLPTEELKNSMIVQCMTKKIYFTFCVPSLRNKLMQNICDVKCHFN